MQVEIPDAPIGAICEGVDLSRPLAQDVFDRLESVFDERSVLCIRGQQLSEPALIDFAMRFGPVVQLYMSDYAHPVHPQIFLVSNIEQNGKPIGHADAGSVWHSDMSFTAHPPRATVMYAVEVPSRDGASLGDTRFASAAAAYDALDAKTKTRIDDLVAVHDVFGRRAKTKSHTSHDEARKRQPKPRHPVVRVHPRTGRKCLYVSPGECVSVDGMADSAARELVETLAVRIPRPENQYCHRWQPGDVLIWDNCALQHRATFDYAWPGERRLMWRITIAEPT